MRVILQMFRFRSQLAAAQMHCEMKYVTYILCSILILLRIFYRLPEALFYMLIEDYTYICGQTILQFNYHGWAWYLKRFSNPYALKTSHNCIRETHSVLFFFSVHLNPITLCLVRRSVSTTFARTHIHIHIQPLTPGFQLRVRVRDSLTDM